jgi:hypothetical protein
MPYPARSLMSFFIDDAAVSALETRVPDASVDSGAFGGSCNGAGIGTLTTNLEQSLPNWTLEDQFENPRTSQIGQLIGGNGIVPRTGNVATTWDKTQVLYTLQGAVSSGGTEGTLPDSTIRLYDGDDLPTRAEKEANPDLDGQLTLPASSASLVDLAIGWVEGA